MSSFSLDLLKHHPKDLLLAEIAALIHDVGKFCNLHVETHSVGGSRKWSNDHAYKAVTDNPCSVILLSGAAANIQKPDALNGILNASSPKASDFLTSDFKATLVGKTVSLLSQTYTLAELVMLGTPGFATHTSRAQLLQGKDGWLPAVLGLCHNEAHHDKQEPAGNEGKQKWPSVFVSTAFGFESGTVVVDGSSNSLDSRLRNLPTPDVSFNKTRLLSEFVYGLGDTRRPINEITLADWATTVAALYKSALATCVLERRTRDIRQWANWEEKLIDHDFRWRLLRVNFDVLRLYAKAIKIADLLAYRHAVDEVCKTLKQLVEEEYPLGNEVYRDTTGIYFTFPDLNLPAELRDEIRRRAEEIEPELAPRSDVRPGSGPTTSEQLKSILHEQLREAKEVLSFPVSRDNYSPCWEAQWRNLPDGKWVVCPVCRLRPKMETEAEDACEHCRGRRRSRIEFWEQNPAKTIWIDEIADHNDRIALLVGKFDLDGWLSGDLVQTMLVQAKPNDPKGCKPKNPSPARLRRIWDTCQRFWTDTVENTILEQHQYANDRPDVALRCSRLFVTPDNKAGWRENVPYDGTIGGQPISLLWQNEKKHFVTIVNLQLTAGGSRTLQELKDKWPGQRVEVSDPNDPRKRRSFTVEVTTPATDSWAPYRPYLTLIRSPDQFLAMIPAADSLAIARRLHEEYRRQFGKVQNRLPLFLGLVFFQRKTPLMAVMDTARRMLKVSMSSISEKTWTVECSRQGNPNWHLRLSQGEQRVSLDVPVTMGDGTPDVWYPYFFVEDGVNITDRPYRFQHNDGRWLVHVKDLHEGDRVSITPSRFAYLFLEHTAQRFRFDLDRDVSLLDELPLLIDMWERLRKSGITDTGLRNIANLLETKATLWRHDSMEFLHLTETTLKVSGLWQRKDKPDTVTPEDVLSGRFFRCLELYLHILKARLKKEREDERQPTTV